MSTISRSTVKDGVVQELPATLLAQARAHVKDLTLDEYALARVIASEAGSRPEAEQLVVADCDRERAALAKVSISEHVIRGGRFGSQGIGGRLQSSRLDPTLRHAQLAIRIVRGLERPAKGGTAYFNPRVQHVCHNAPKQCSAIAGQLNRNQSARAVAESWSFVMTRLSCGRDVAGRYVCTYGPRGKPRQQWVGDIVGVDPWNLMVFRPKADAGHAMATARALEVIEMGARGKSSVFGGGSVAVWAVAGVGVAAWLASRGALKA